MATSPGSTTRTVTGPELRSIKVRRGAKSCVCFSFVDVPGDIWVRSLRPMAREGVKIITFFVFFLCNQLNALRDQGLVPPWVLLNAVRDRGLVPPWVL